MRKKRGQRLSPQGWKWVVRVTAGYRVDNSKPIRKYIYADTQEKAAR